jgi:small subunit ribosomal protein S9
MSTTTPASKASTLGLTMPGTPPVDVVKPIRAPKPADKNGWWWGTGRRKTAVARVRIKPADGKDATIALESVKLGKKKSVEEYFSEERDRVDCVAPLKAAGMLGRFKIVVKMHGGGYMGQAGAMKMGLARALCDFDPTLDKPLRDAGFLTRDSRKVERKKYGQPGARRRFQFSKR